MKLERLITIVTNLAVVAGMVLVVFELQQNREAIHARGRTQGVGS